MVSFYRMKRFLIVLLLALLPLPLFGSDYSSSIEFFLKGYRSETRGDHEEALAYYGAALKFNPDSAEIRAELAFLYIKKGDTDKAEELLKEAIEINPTSHDALFLLAGTYSAKGDLAKAKTLYEKCIALNPEDTEAYLYLGSLYVAEKRYKDALTIYEKILEYDSENIISLYYAARLSAEIKDYKKANTLYDKVLELKPNFEPALLDLATINEIEGNLEKAIEYYQKVISIDPMNKKARSRIAAIFIQQKEYDRAILEFEELSGIDRKDLSIRIRIGLLHLEQRRFDEAIREFNFVLTSTPGNNTVRLYLAMSWKEKGDLKKAIEEFLKVDPKSEEFSNALKNLAFLYIKTGSPDDGIKTMERYLGEVKPTVEIYILLSMLYEEKTDYVKGIASLEEARRIEPNNPDVLYQIGMLHEKTGNTDTALTFMEEVLKIDAEYANALNFIGYTWAEKGIRLDEAEAMIKKAITKKPEDGYILDSLGWVYYKKGNYNGALTAILKAHQLMPDDPTIAEHLGDVYAVMKDNTKAIHYYDKSIQLEKKEERRKILEVKIKQLKDNKK
jgi:tetratricopeptide (TPR) repeat protein